MAQNSRRWRNDGPNVLNRIEINFLIVHCAIIQLSSVGVASINPIIFSQLCFVKAERFWIWSWGTPHSHPNWSRVGVFKLQYQPIWSRDTRVPVTYIIFLAHIRSIFIQQPCGALKIIVIIAENEGTNKEKVEWERCNIIQFQKKYRKDTTIWHRNSVQNINDLNKNSLNLWKKVGLKI